jgi:uncharacterized protein (DUF58 family)
MSLLQVFKSSDPAKSTKIKDIFPEDFIRKLEKLRFVVKKMLFSGTVGEKTMKQKGGRIEFAGHREYTHGDETRYIDWNAFARLERLYIKEFAREESVPLHILLDISASMLSGELGINGISKIDYAKQLVVAFGYIGLITGQPVRFFAFSNNSFYTSQIFESDKQLFEMMDFLRRLETSGQTDFYDAFTKFDRATTKKGFLIFLSDLFENSGKDSRKILERLNGRGFMINIMHISSGLDELSLLRGLYRLRDSESGEERVVWVDDRISSVYKRTFLSFSEEWNSFCLKHNMKYFYLNTRTPMEDVVFRLLRKRELLK